jgi:hypothetical protein
MDKTLTFSNAVALFLFNNVPIAGIGDVAGLLGSSADGSFYLSLYTASPGADGLQDDNEAAYTNYIRIAIARTAVGWNVVGGSASNAGQALWAVAGSTGEELTHWGVGTAPSGPGYLLGSARLPGVPLVVTAGEAPNADAGALKWGES